MAAVLALILIVLSALSFSIVLDQDAVEMLPFTIFAFILYYYLFYCANLLAVGIISLYLLIAALFFFAWTHARKNKINAARKITPALVVFCSTAVLYLYFTADNYSINWDELRVWSAMPKAIYETKELQLGSQALIFDTSDNMQTYPPALPLFSNFFLSGSATFKESYIFLAYTIFVSAITVNPFRQLRWKHWWAMPFAAVFIVFAPFVLTFHGGDYSYFYESLFIDPVLGFAAGYAFYLATQKPLQSRFSQLQFALALGVLVIIKDSGILFAALCVVCAFFISLFEEKKPFAQQVRSLLVPVAVMCISYFLWKGLLRYYNISNHVSFHITFPTLASLRALAEAILRAPIIQLIVAEFSFAVYALILLLLCGLVEALLKPYAKANSAGAFLLVVASSLFFALGYILIFPFPTYDMLLGVSFLRYFTTLTAAFLTFAFLRYFPVVFQAIPTERAFIKIPTFALCLIVLLGTPSALSHCETDYDNMYSDFLVRARNEKPKILQEIPVDPTQRHQRVYLMMAEKEPNIFHHRFYFELLGTGINIENFYPDTDMYNGRDPSPYSVEETAEKWYARLQKEGYDYIYVYSTNETYEQAFAHLGLGEAIPGRAYKVSNERFSK